MRAKGPIIADQTIEGSSLSISICYTSPLAQEADAPTVASSEQSGMDEEMYSPLLKVIILMALAIYYCSQTR